MEGANKKTSFVAQSRLLSRKAGEVATEVHVNIAAATRRYRRRTRKAVLTDGMLQITCDVTFSHYALTERTYFRDCRTSAATINSPNNSYHGFDSTLQNSPNSLLSLL